MINYYLKGFKLGFQPEKSTAKRVYDAIIQREPNFLEKQVPDHLSAKQKQGLGQFEGEFLSTEVEVNRQKVEFSDLAKELLFGKKPLAVEPTKPKPFAQTVDTKASVTDTTVSSQTNNTRKPQKEDESIWEL